MKVKSSSIETVDYVWGNIVVKFKTWSVYSYKAPVSAYDKFMKAESKWWYVKNILSKSFTYKKVK